MSDETATEILATFNRESDRLRRADRAADDGERVPEEPQSSRFEATIEKTTGQAFDPVGELDQFRHTGAESESMNLREIGKLLDGEIESGRQVVKANPR